MIHCRVCNHAIPVQDAKFCGHCGGAVQSRFLHLSAMAILFLVVFAAFVIVGEF